MKNLRNDLQRPAKRLVHNTGIPAGKQQKSSSQTKKGKPISPKYREFILGLLRQIYYDGMRSGDLSRTQVPTFPKVEVPDSHFDFLTEDEQSEILAKISKYDYPIYHTILWYGIRPSEVRALKRDCVIGDFDQIVIRRTFTRNNILRENPKETDGGLSHYWMKLKRS